MNADKFEKADSLYKGEFYRILEFIVFCYPLMLRKYTKIENDENKIRNRLCKDFLNNNSVRKRLDIDHYIFTCEESEIDEDYHESGYTDIKIYTLAAFTNTKAYYIIECKRIDGSSVLNQKYVRDGVLRFVTGKYPSYNSISGMLGFVVKKINIDNNILSINDYLKKHNRSAKTIRFLMKTKLIKNFKYSYRSTHNHSKSSQIEIYHLMLNYSGLINIPCAC